MSIHRVLLAGLTIAVISAPVLAQDNKPSTSPAPSVSSSSKPATTGSTTAPVAAKVNLNTAAAAQIDKLPKMTHAQSKAIVEARAKAKFKDWDDFVGRKLVPADSAAAIKDVVTF
jgi:competence protein ComEA